MFFNMNETESTFIKHVREDDMYYSVYEDVVKTERKELLQEHEVLDLKNTHEELLNKKVDKQDLIEFEQNELNALDESLSNFEGLFPEEVEEDTEE